MVVIDIQMPESCLGCPLYERASRFCIVGSQGCVDRYFYDPNEKPEWCPIVEETY